MLEGPAARRRPSTRLGMWCWTGVCVCSSSSGRSAAIHGGKGGPLLGQRSAARPTLLPFFPSSSLASSRPCLHQCCMTTFPPTHSPLLRSTERYVYIAMAGQHQIWRYDTSSGVAGEGGEMRRAQRKPFAVFIVYEYRIMCEANCGANLKISSLNEYL